MSSSAPMFSNTLHIKVSTNNDAIEFYSFARLPSNRQHVIDYEFWNADLHQMAISALDLQPNKRHTIKHYSFIGALLAYMLFEHQGLRVVVTCASAQVRSNIVSNTQRVMRSSKSRVDKVRARWPSVAPGVKHPNSSLVGLKMLHSPSPSFLYVNIDGQAIPEYKWRAAHHKAPPVLLSPKQNLSGVTGAFPDFWGSLPCVYPSVVTSINAAASLVVTSGEDVADTDAAKPTSDQAMKVAYQSQSPAPLGDQIVAMAYNTSCGSRNYNNMECLFCHLEFDGNESNRISCSECQALAYEIGEQQ